jgi:peptide/nickel transport system permease protein
MSKNNSPLKKNTPVVVQQVTGTEEMHLDDARRVKVLSPGMLVFKRFIRNSLAVIGFGIILFMFLFAFVGPLFSPYSQTDVFTGTGTMYKDYAGATYNEELRYTVAEGQQFDSGARAQFLLALSKNQATFTYKDASYFYASEDENSYRIMQLEPIADTMLGVFRPLGDTEITEDLKAAYQTAIDSGETHFELGGVDYRITKSKKAYQISIEHDLALASLDVFDPVNESDKETVSSFNFKLNAIQAIVDSQDSFSVDGQNYRVSQGDAEVTIFNNAGDEFAVVSSIIVNPLDQNIFLTVDYKRAVREAIINKSNEFSYTAEDGIATEYTIVRVNTTYNVRKVTTTELIRQYEAPSWEHPLGLDNNGMDLMTRLMFGGRVSLMVGFIVVFLEVCLGVIIGGISGYFGKVIDTILMRFVDLFNSIPFYPMVLIFGSVMDTLEVKPMARIMILMAILGILGWTGVARIVRGQILSLREQDFMVATEATGIRTSRRIFKHLIPNVMPLLIVYATAGLGEVIIAEATLGFLGLGIKYPLASWGSIINVASDSFVMTNYWFMWIPAGLMILLTVLGFNFVGDGLRDAYDPKMKR